MAPRLLLADSSRRESDSANNLRYHLDGYDDTGAKRGMSNGPGAVEDVAQGAPGSTLTGPNGSARPGQRARRSGAPTGSPPHDILATKRSATITAGRFVFARGTMGMMEASTTYKPSMPWTRPSLSTTASGSVAGPILTVPTG